MKSHDFSYSADARPCAASATNSAADEVAAKATDAAHGARPRRTATVAVPDTATDADPVAVADPDADADTDKVANAGTDPDATVDVTAWPLRTVRE